MISIFVPILIWRKKVAQDSIKDTAVPTCKATIFLFYKLNVYLFDILLGRVYKEIPEATNTYIYCTSVKDYLLKLLSEPAYRLTRPIEIDYNFIEVEDQYLFDIAGKHFIKERFIRYEYNEYKKPNPAPFIEGMHFHFAIFLDSNQLISKLNVCPKVFCLQL